MKGTVKLNREFRYAYTRGKKVVLPILVMHYFKNRTNDTKYGITVSTSIGKAHTRNHVKRLIREAYKNEKKLIKQGYNIIWVARTKTACASFLDVKKAVKKCIDMSGLRIDIQ